MSKDENPGECECCGFETKNLKKFDDLDTTISGGGKIVKSDFWFCDLCASTPASTTHRYPGRYEGCDVMKTICYVGNVLLTEMRKPWIDKVLS